MQSIEFKYDTWSQDPESWNRIANTYGGVMTHGTTGLIRFSYAAGDPSALVSGNGTRFAARSRGAWTILRESNESLCFAPGTSFRFVVGSDFAGAGVIFESD